MSQISFGFKEFLYSLIVNQEIYKFLEELDMEKDLKILVNITNNHLQVNSEILNNLSRWQDMNTNQSREQRNHFRITLQKFKNFCQQVEQKYYQIQQYFIEDKKVCRILGILVSIQSEKMRQECQQALAQIIMELNNLLNINEIEILDIDLSKQTMQIRIYGDINDKPNILNDTLQDYIDTFEIEEIKPESTYMPLIEKLSQKHNFVYIQKEENRENTSQNDKQDSGSENESEQESEEDESEKFILVRKKDSRHEQSLNEIALIIEQENCDRFREFDDTELEIFDKIQYLISEFQFDIKIFKRYNVLIQIQDNSINIYGNKEGQYLIDLLVLQIKQNQNIGIKSVNRQKSLVEQTQEDVENENQKFKKDRTQLTLIDITFDAYSKILIHEDDQNEESDSVKTSIITFNFSPQQESIFEDIFKESTFLLEISKTPLSEFQIQYFQKYGIKYSKTSPEYLKLTTTKWKYDKFLSDFNETKDNILMKKELNIELIFFKILLKNKKSKINKLHKKYKFTIINEQQEDSQQHQINLICSQKDKDKIVKKLDKYIKTVKQDVVEIVYQINEQDLNIFSQKSDELMQEICKQDIEIEKGEEEEDVQKNTEKSQIYLQYYLADLTYEFRNNLIDLQRERNNNINKNFKLILEQNEVTKIENNNSTTNITKNESIISNKKEVSIQLISTYKFENQIQTLIQGSGASNLIITDHLDDNHTKKLEQLFNSSDLLYQLQGSDSANEKLANYIKLDELKVQIKNSREQQICIKIQNKIVKEQNQQDKYDNFDNLVLVGENIIDEMFRIVNSQQLDQQKQDFFKFQFVQALEQGKQIQIMITNNNLRNKILQILLEVLEGIKVYKISQKFTHLKIYFIQPVESSEKDILEKELKIKKEQKNEEQLKMEIQKTEEDIQNTLQIFKENQKQQQQKAYVYKTESARKWYFYLNEVKVQEFTVTNCIIIDQYYRNFLKQKGESNNDLSLMPNQENDKLETKYYFIGFFQQEDSSEQLKEQSIEADPDDEEEEQEDDYDRRVIINLLSDDVYIKFLDLNISFQLFFKFYPHLDQIIKSMKSVLNDSQVNKIILTATFESAEQNSFKNLIFEDTVYEIQFNDDKYILQSVNNPHFLQLEQPKTYLINRQSLVSSQVKEDDNNQIIQHENVVIKYNFVREEQSLQNEKYYLKILVEKNDKEQLEKNLKLFFDVRRKHYEKSQKFLLEKIKKENSLKFFYYTPKLRKFLIKQFKVNKYEILSYELDSCFYMITSNSKTSIQNFQNQTKKLSIYYEENWKELANEMKSILQQKEVESSEADQNQRKDKYVITQLTNVNSQFLSSLKEWEINGFKFNSFQINSLEYSNIILQTNEKFQILYSIIQSKDPFQQLSQLLQTKKTSDIFNANKYSRFEDLKEIYNNLPEAKIKDIKEINVLVFLSLNEEINRNSIPLFYLYFTKN